MKKSVKNQKYGSILFQFLSQIEQELCQIRQGCVGLRISAFVFFDFEDKTD